MTIVEIAACVVVLVGLICFQAAMLLEAQDENERLRWDLAAAERGRDAARLIVQDIGHRRDQQLLANKMWEAIVARKAERGYEDGAEFSRRVSA